MARTKAEQAIHAIADKQNLPEWKVAEALLSFEDATASLTEDERRAFIDALKEIVEAVRRGGSAELQ